MHAWRHRFACLLAAAGLVLAAPACALDPELPPERYTITRWSADDGLPHSQIHDIDQSPDGFLWVTTWEGTARFDGLGFSEVARLHDSSGAPRPSRRLWRDADGSMLVAVDGPGLVRVPPNGEARPACRDIAVLQVSQLAPGIDGVPWLAARDGLYRLLADGRCTRVAGGQSLAGRTVHGMLAQEDGSLWLGLRGGLFRWHGGRLEALGERLGLPAGEVRALVRDAGGATWIASERGVWRHRDGRLQAMRAERAEGLLLDDAGALWVTGTDSVVLRHRNGRWHRWGEDEGVVGYATGALFQDREGLVWFGTTHGLFRIADGPVRGIARQPGLPSDYIRSVLQTGDGQVWIGHSLGLSRIRDARPELLFPLPGTPPSSVLALAPAAGGGVWAGTYNRGVLRVGPGDPAPVRPLATGDHPLATEQVRALLEDPDGTLWIGTERGLVAWRDGRLDPQPLPGLPALPVRALQRSGDGRLWIGQLGGMAWREPDGHLVVLRPDQGFPAQSAFDFLHDADGGTWVASNRGVLHQRDGGWRQYGATQGLRGSSVFRLLDDAHGNLWMSGNHGVMRVPRRSFEAVDRGARARLDVQVFDRDDGMPSRQANGGSAPAGWRMANGEVWLPTASGVAVFDPALVMERGRGEVPLVIDALQIDGRQLAPSEVGVLQPGARVQIRYAGLSLRQPNALRYRYRMQGVDADWIEAGTAREVTYTNLPTGRLRFEVQVAHAPADWSRPAASTGVDLQVDPPWWARPWAVVPGAATLLLAFVLLHQALGRRQRRRARALEAEVAQRTAQLREKNRELEEASRQRERLVEQLAHQASHDPLTGLPNRRAGDQRLASALQQADAAHAPMCVAIVDLDRFKHINDRYGHQGGDRVLAQVARQMQASLRRPGLSVSRLGGEEFLVVMRDTALPAAVSLLERARRDIAALTIGPDEDVAIACTISAGVVERNGHEGADALLQRADAALYEAKRQGRDRVVTG